MFHLEFEHFETIDVARFSGEMTLTTALDLREQLEQEVKTMKSKDMALDLADVSAIDSTGLGVLVGISTKARSWGKRLMLYRTPPVVQSLLEKVQITGFFPVLEDENDLKARQLRQNA